MNARENPKSLKEALTMFQEMNVTATKNTSNEYFKSTYSDLTSVITAVNHGAEFGLSFSQSVEYKNIILERVKTENGTDVKYQELHRDIFVKTIVSHIQDKETLECTVPVLINGNDKDNPQKILNGEMDPILKNVKNRNLIKNILPTFIDEISINAAKKEAVIFNTWMNRTREKRHSVKIRTTKDLDKVTGDKHFFLNGQSTFFEHDLFWQ